MRRIYGILICFIVLIAMVGCKGTAMDAVYEADIKLVEDKESAMSTEEKDQKINVEKVELITVEEFKNKYSLKDGEIPDEYIEKYIECYGYSKSDLNNSLVNHGAKLKDDYEKGVVYGYSLDTRFLVSNMIDKNDLSDEFFDNTEYIFIEFTRSMKSSDVYKYELMSINLKNNKIYYGGDRRNYSDADDIQSADLTEEDKKAICDEIRNHINVNAPDDRKREMEAYSFKLWIFSENNQYVGFESTDKDENGFPGFDTYWKELYKKYFGEEF